MNDIIIDFIHRRFSNDCHWLNGNCYYFALILQNRFPNGKILYDVINGHFVYEINNIKYDWSGKNKECGKHKWIEWNKFQEYDKFQYERIVRDCIL